MGVAAAEATQAVGALLLLGLLTAPAGTALRCTARPYAALALSAGFALAAMWAGLVISYLAPKVPPSFADLVEKLTPTVVNISTTQKVKGGMPGMELQMPEGGEVPEQFKDFLEQFGKQQGGGKHGKH